MLKISSALAFALLASACSGENAPVVPFQIVDTTPPTSSTSSSASETPANAPDPSDDSLADAGATPPSDDAGTVADSGSPALDAGAVDPGMSDGGAIVVPTTDAGPTVDAGGPGHTTGGVTFHHARAVLAGSGCSDASASIALDAAGFRVTFSEMKIDLRGGTALSERRACAVRVPIDIPLGYYIARIDQKLDYSIRRSAGAKAALSTNATVFGLPSSPYTINHDGVLAETVAHASVRSPVRFAAGSAEAIAMCSATRATGGMLALNLALTAQRTPTQSVAVAIDAFEFHEGVDVAIASCP